ncbi:16S rRNA (guanine(966)-N(2))-methyltransferase RsmD [Ideonella sp.]|uniref:16S rRNA (guanine(966)-N(2))-methyltransferase RsmD n=1 Tax=Ideonella sp. TaxID=1929293 RepID=UPI0035B2D73D
MKPARGPAPPRPGGASRAPHQVRIIGGQWRRSVLPVASLPGLRPTPDRVRETLFNWLGQDLTGWRVLDAFAGSGALGFEAASRGAAEVLLVEHDPTLVRSLDASRERLKATGLRVQRGDGLGVLRGGRARWELVLLDPPFDAGLAQPALAAAAGAVVPGGWVYLESGEPAPAPPAGLRLHRSGRAGAVHYALFQADPA